MNNKKYRTKLVISSQEIPRNLYQALNVILKLISTLFAVVLKTGAQYCIKGKERKKVEELSSITKPVCVPKLLLSGFF